MKVGGRAPTDGNISIAHAATGRPSSNPRWECVYALDAERKPNFGSTEALASAIRRGADLRAYSEFRNNEHLDPNSDNSEIVQELMDFRLTYLLDSRWVAGIINLRQPISLPNAFGARRPCPFFCTTKTGRRRSLGLTWTARVRADADVAVSDHSLTMRQVGIAELKSRVSEYLRAVRRRETISVLDRETPVAQIVPVREKSRLDIRKPTPVSPPPNRVQLPKVRSEELPFWVRTRSLHFY